MQQQMSFVVENGDLSEVFANLSGDYGVSDVQSFQPEVDVQFNFRGRIYNIPSERLTQLVLTIPEGMKSDLLDYAERKCVQGTGPQIIGEALPQASVG